MATSECFVLKDVGGMDAEAEPTGTKLQEHVLNSEAARRVKYMDVFYKYLRRATECDTSDNAIYNLTLRRFD